MKTVLIILTVLLFCFGCDRNEREFRTIERVENYCLPDSIEKRAVFILKCIKNANPQSDEEPEDWMLICKDMAINTFCPSVTVVVSQSLAKTYGSRWRDTNVTVQGEGNHE